MKLKNNIEKAIKNKLNFAASAEMRQRILSDVTNAHEDSNKIKSTLAGPNIRNIIMISPITKLAAAAMIVIAVLIYIDPFNGYLNGTTAAYAKVKEAVRNVPWMHISYTGGYRLDDEGNKLSKEGELDTEIWYSFKSKVVIYKYSNGRIDYRDYANQEFHAYNPVSKRVVITALSDKKFTLGLGADTPWIWLERNIERMISFGGEVTRKKGQYNRQDVDVFEIASTDRPGIASIRCKIFVDKETSLPIAEERKYINTNTGKPQRIGTRTYDYPEQGPKDIYAIGLPSDTQTINSLPLPAWWDIKQAYQSYRRKAPEKYIAIVTSERSLRNTWVEHVDIVYSDGIRFRTERHFLSRGGGFVGVQWQQQKEEFGNTFDSILKWSQTQKAYGDISITIYKGQYYYHSRRDDGKWTTKKQKISRQLTAHDFWNVCPIVRIGWPNIRGYVDVIQDDYARENKLIHLELQTHEFYLNPNKDYICQKKIWYDYDQETDVIEYGQTKEGMWYPRKTKGSQSNTVFLETDPEFPEGIFDPEKLPK
jgi:hypothetical protein